MKTHERKCVQNTAEGPDAGLVEGGRHYIFESFPIIQTRSANYQPFNIIPDRDKGRKC